MALEHSYLVIEDGNLRCRRDVNAKATLDRYKRAKKVLMHHHLPIIVLRSFLDLRSFMIYTRSNYSYKQSCGMLLSEILVRWLYHFCLKRNFQRSAHRGGSTQRSSTSSREKT